MPQSPSWLQRFLAAAAGDGTGRNATRRILYVWVSIVVLVLAYAAFSRFFVRNDEAARPVASIAVLPFDNIGDDPENEYFTDGITEDIIAQLTKLGDLKVISRTSVMQYKDVRKPVRQIADELGVETILDGSVRLDAGRVRIVTQLVNARTDRQLWAEQYDRELRDICAIQSDVSEQIAQALHTQLSPDVRQRITRQPTADLEAYQLYLRGRFFWNKRSQEGLTRALEFFNQAIARDTTFALAWAGLADVYVVLPFYQLQSPADEHDQARTAAERALHIDPLLGEAHAALGYTRWYDYDWGGADRDFRRAIELNPGYATGNQWYGLFLAAWGRVREGEARMARALQLDPLSLIINAELGLVRYYDHRFVEAIEQLHRTVQMDSTFARAWAFLSVAYQQTGQFREALDASDRTRKLYGAPPAAETPLRRAFAARPTAERYFRIQLAQGLALEQGGSTLRATWHAGLGEEDEAFRSLDSALDRRDVLLAFAAVEPGLDPLRDDPRFRRILERLNLR